MKTALLTAALAAASLSFTAAPAATFDYHGTLREGGHPAEGAYDVELTLYSAPEGGEVLGGPLLMYAVPVHDGAFNTRADFGPVNGAGRPSWLGVKMRNAGKGEFAALSARQPLASDALASAGCPGSWSLDGNAGNPAGSYLGTADDQPLTLKVNGKSVLRVTEKTTSSPGDTCLQWIGGTSNNSVTGQFGCGTIAGGGRSGYPNTVTGDYGSILGGQQNSAASFGSVGGGYLNSAGFFAVVPGGYGNKATGNRSFAAGSFARADHDYAFVWSDSGPTVFGSTGVAQFDIRAGGGMAVNGTPKNDTIEVSIFPTAASQLNYSNLFLGNTGRSGGILVSAGDETTDTSNDAGFYIDQYNGAAQARRLQVAPTGGIGLNSNPGSGTALSIAPPGGTGNALSVDLYGARQWTLDVDTVGNFAVVDNTTQLARLKLDVNGGFYVSGAAYKPGGGSWSIASDRRIKQDIEPIGNAIDTLMKLRPVSYRYTPEYRALEHGVSDKTYHGFVAQDYAEVFPEHVTSTRVPAPGAPRGAAPILALDPNPALITTVAALQELAVQAQQRDDELARMRDENARLRGTLDRVLARLDRLEHGAEE